MTFLFMQTAALPPNLPAVVQEIPAEESRMQKATKLFQEVLKKKRELKTLQEAIKEEAQQEPDYQDAKDAHQTATESIKSIKTRVENRNPANMEKIKELKKDVREDSQILDEFLFLEFQEKSKIDEVKPEQLALFDEEQVMYIPQVRFELKSMPKTEDPTSEQNSEEFNDFMDN